MKRTITAVLVRQYWCDSCALRAAILSAGPESKIPPPSHTVCTSASSPPALATRHGSAKQFHQLVQPTPSPAVPIGGSSCSLTFGSGQFSRPPT